MAQTQKNTNTATASSPVSANQAKAGDKRSSTSLFALLDSVEGRDHVAKSAFLGDIRQKLAQVADEAKKHGAEAEETERLAATQATRLFIARRDGVISGEELNALLGDTFGYVPKKDGTPGKTPEGTGRVIRMRVVRALQGYEYINGGDGGRFFEPMAVNDVAPVVNAIGREKDGITVWQAYKSLGDIKSKQTVRLPFAFDPKKVIGMTAELSEAGARETLIGNRSLLKAYRGLFEQIQILTQADASEIDAISARLGNGPNNPVEAETETEEGETLAA